MILRHGTMPVMLKSKKFWGIAASFLFLLLALQKVELEKIPEILAGLKYQYFFLMCISYTFEHLIRGVRWQLILSGRAMSFKHAYFGIVLGYLFNNLFPARAGEFLRAFYLKKKKIAPAGEAFGSVVFERFLDGIVIVALIVFLLHNFTVTPMIRKASFTALVFYCLVLFAILILQFRRSLFEKITDKIFSIFPVRLSTFFNSIRKSFIDGLGLIGQPFILVQAIVVSFVAWAFSILTVWLCLQMFSFNMGVAEAILLISVLSIGSMIPSSPGMIGVYEFCCVLVINGMLNLSPELAATFGLISHSVGYLYVLGAGFIVLAIEGLKFSDLRQKESEEFAAN